MRTIDNKFELDEQVTVIGRSFKTVFRVTAIIVAENALYYEVLNSEHDSIQRFQENELRSEDNKDFTEGL